MRPTDYPRGTHGVLTGYPRGTRGGACMRPTDIDEPARAAQLQTNTTEAAGFHGSVYYYSTLGARMRLRAYG